MSSRINATVEPLDKSAPNAKKYKGQRSEEARIRRGAKRKEKRRLARLDKKLFFSYSPPVDQLGVHTFPFECDDMTFARASELLLTDYFHPDEFQTRDAIEDPAEHHVVDLKLVPELAVQCDELTFSQLEVGVEPESDVESVDDDGLKSGCNDVPLVPEHTQMIWIEGNLVWYREVMDHSKISFDRSQVKTELDSVYTYDTWKPPKILVPEFSNKSHLTRPCEVQWVDEWKATKKGFVISTHYEHRQTSVLTLTFKELELYDLEVGYRWIAAGLYWWQKIGYPPYRFAPNFRYFMSTVIIDHRNRRAIYDLLITFSVLAHGCVIARTDFSLKGRSDFDFIA